MEARNYSREDKSEAEALNLPLQKNRNLLENKTDTDNDETLNKISSFTPTMKNTETNEKEDFGDYFSPYRRKTKDDRIIYKETAFVYNIDGDNATIITTSPKRKRRFVIDSGILAEKDLLCEGKHLELIVEQKKGIIRTRLNPKPEADVTETLEKAKELDLGFLDPK